MPLLVRLLRDVVGPFLPAEVFDRRNTFFLYWNDKAITIPMYGGGNGSGYLPPLEGLGHPG